MPWRQLADWQPGCVMVDLAVEDPNINKQPSKPWRLFEDHERTRMILLWSMIKRRCSSSLTIHLSSINKSHIHISIGHHQPVLIIRHKEISGSPSSKMIIDDWLMVIKYHRIHWLIVRKMVLMLSQTFFRFPTLSLLRIGLFLLADRAAFWW